MEMTDLASCVFLVKRILDDSKYGDSFSVVRRTFKQHSERNGYKAMLNSPNQKGNKSEQSNQLIKKHKHNARKQDMQEYL
jgi:hypothetical protein